MRYIFMRVFCDEQPGRGGERWPCRGCGVGMGLRRCVRPWPAVGRYGPFCSAGRAVLQCRTGRFAMPNGTYCAAPVEG